MRSMMLPSRSCSTKRMPFGCSGSVEALCQTRWTRASNGTVLMPSSVICPSSAARSSLSSTEAGSSSCGVSPIRPRITALSVAWPTPVSASEPYRCASTPTASSSMPLSSRKRRAATIGPTVWELDGPMPILNKSNTLMSILCLLLFYCEARSYAAALMPTSILASIESTISSIPMRDCQPQWAVARLSSRLFGHESAIC